MIVTAGIIDHAVTPKDMGAVAQLGERVVRNDEVSGSIPLSSTGLSPNAGFVLGFSPNAHLPSCSDSVRMLLSELRTESEATD